MAKYDAKEAKDQPNMKRLKMKDPFYVLGYDIGGTKIAICLAKCHNTQSSEIPGDIIAERRIAGGSKQGPGTALDEMIKAADQLLEEEGITPSDLKAIGLCAPGPIDIPNGLMLASPNMPEWDKVPIVEALTDHFATPVHFQNDANGGVLAEAMFGAASGKSDVVYLTMSTGIGGGVISNNVLIDGVSGIGTELGHIILDAKGPKCGCGMHGCFEAYCGGKASEKRLQKIASSVPNHPFMSLPGVEGEVSNLDLKVLTDAAKAGNKAALEFWDEYCKRLAQGIGACLMTFNPQTVILGTIAIHNGDFLMKPVKEYLKQFAWKEHLADFNLSTSSLGTRIGELAGIAVALYGMKQK